jgi:hypothetical protein
MTLTTTTPMVRLVLGRRATRSERLEARAAARANHGPTPQQIELRAFQIHQARGGLDGHDIEDWQQAERELRRNGYT